GNGHGDGEPGGRGARSREPRGDGVRRFGDHHRRRRTAASVVTALVALALAAAPVRYGAEPPVELAPIEKATLDAVAGAQGGKRPAVSGALVIAARALAARAAAGDP